MGKWGVGEMGEWEVVEGGWVSREELIRRVICHLSLVIGENLEERSLGEFWRTISSQWLFTQF
jgi:hypothetical protein